MGHGKENVQSFFLSCGSQIDARVIPQQVDVETSSGVERQWLVTLPGQKEAIRVVPIHAMDNAWAALDGETGPPAHGDSVRMAGLSVIVTNHKQMESVVRPGVFCVHTDLGWSWVRRIHPIVPVWTEAEAWA